MRLVGRLVAARAAVLGAAVLVAGCGGAGERADEGVPATDTGDVVSAEQVGGFPPGDSRPALLAELGAPDAFVISVDEVDGTVVRFESWRWFDERTQVDIVDGEVVWSVLLDPLPDRAVLPLAYNPTEFEMLASIAEVHALLAGVELHEIDASDDVEVPGAVLLVGEQLLLAFVDDRLVFVEAVPLLAGAPEVVG